MELPSETAAHSHCQAALASKQGSGVSSRRMSVTRRPKELNLATYKYHALADYPDTIRRFGTTDNYNTQTVRNSIWDSILLNKLMPGRAQAPPFKALICTFWKEK